MCAKLKFTPENVHVVYTKLVVELNVILYSWPRLHDPYLHSGYFEKCYYIRSHSKELSNGLNFSEHENDKIKTPQK